MSNGNIMGAERARYFFGGLLGCLALASGLL